MTHYKNVTFSNSTVMRLNIFAKIRERAVFAQQKLGDLIIGYNKFCWRQLLRFVVFECVRLLTMYYFPNVLYKVLIFENGANAL